MTPEFDLTDARLVAATVADCPTLAALACSAHSHPWSERQYRDSLKVGHDSWLLWSREGEAIACCVISRLFDAAEILDIAVAPRWRRRGVAGALLRQLLAQLPPEIERVLLEVRASNRAARSLYRKLGFREDGLRKNYYPADGGAREDAVLMSLCLEHP
ncbi:ribosomal protein S18-alanine N-acetyltransferase [Microbulbifer rhizosphaerae]|uniref:Ribosomal-protein-alanine N-acetyltransferase n=1 Tax=Microbulbifer rhizosphaerae TaxID=1562603 RepID=A0A7W4WDQ7_9GAMM|nr:ribosomal protein S18-alanine N-acetyltransferase [Microbulbifer rhizosphaerae]MBB3062343.1 ribosomal-protein-alanine N-acetyltransferase [Microbulbifer rhizosphaerae]